MSGWVPMRVDWWVEVATSLSCSGQPWPDEAILFDLRWWEDQEQMGILRRPGRPALCSRWNRPDGWGIRRLMRMESTWKDDVTGDQRPTSDRPATDQRPTRTTGEDTQESVSDDQRPTSDRPATDQEPATRANLCTPSQSTGEQIHSNSSAEADGSETEASGIPSWVPSQKTLGRHSRAAVLSMVASVVEAVSQTPFVPERGKTAGKEVLGLWHALGEPDPATLAADVALVAEAARECPHPLFAHDVRWEHKPGEGVDRSRSVATLCVQRRWDERLQAARDWESKGKPRGKAVSPGRRVRSSHFFSTAMPVRSDDEDLALWRRENGLDVQQLEAV